MKCNKKKEVTKFDDIGLSWQQDSSIENCENLFIVMYGWFDLQKVVLMSHTVSLKLLQGLREWSLATTVLRMMMTVMMKGKVTMTTR
jgi:hypothetical protein